MEQNQTNNKWLAITGIGLGVFMATLDSSIVNISLPTLVESFHTNLATIEWVILSYTLVLTSLMLGAARLGDMFNKKKLYLGGLTVFVLGSFLCGLAPSANWLIAFRALQGLGATFMQALGGAIVTEIFPSSERGRALGVMGSTVSVGIAVGPPLGGLLIGLLGWRSVFWVNVPVGLFTWLIIQRFVPPSTILRRGQRFDAAGALILFFAMGSYALGMTLGQDQGFRTLPVLLLLGLALVGLTAFILVERRTTHPMVDLSLFHNPLISANLLMAFLVFIVLSAGFIFPFLLQNVLGYSTEMVGLLMMANPIAMGLVAPLAGSLSDRFGSRVISLVGLIILAGGCLGMSTLHPGVTPLGIILRLVPLGVGMGVFQSPNNSAIMGAAPRDRLGVASGLVSLSRTLGSTTGLPLIGSIFTAQVMAFGNFPPGFDITTAPPSALISGVVNTYMVAVFFILASLGLAVFAWQFDRRQKALALQSEEARGD
ncbi:MAG TPA: MFS transporter [Anaerolinea thermolimosa]|uniref:Drug resistance transporter, EmrB/QacA subfamily n=1 Tax=Anaerolinea thermolimosa TaxID=229919 RepID=A0A3D1JJM5_9CHLR|nr:MFS transporter [Anaerolinea thermolimosa]GAP08556.1 drug resistance transporter, EmrB/QacA subfamily [Anaerolinea thermolimosa]HCE17826.1 MFS transporter [Anaerolinea thermolimosa]